MTQNRKFNDSIIQKDYVLARYFDLQNDIDKAIGREKVNKDELDYYRRKISFFIRELRHDSNMLSEEQKDILDSAINIQNKLQTMIDEI